MTRACQASLSITNSWSLLTLMSIELVMPSNHLILCRLLLLLPSIFTSIRVFQMSLFFASGGQSIGVSASASVLPNNIQDWFPLGWTGWISLTLLLSAAASTPGRCFHFDSISSFFLKSFLHSSPVAYWAPTDLGSSSFSVLSFCLFIPFMGFSRQEYWSGLPFPSPVDHVLSELSTVTRLSWVAPHSMAHSFIELDKAVIHVTSLVIFLWLWFSIKKREREVTSL